MLDALLTKKRKHAWSTASDLSPVSSDYVVAAAAAAALKPTAELAAGCDAAWDGTWRSQRLAIV